MYVLLYKILAAKKQYGINSLIMENNDYLKHGRMVVLLQIVGKGISIHESSTTLKKSVQTLFEELDIYPGHVVFHHFLHLVLHHRI